MSKYQVCWGNRYSEQLFLLFLMFFMAPKQNR